MSRLILKISASVLLIVGLQFQALAQSSVIVKEAALSSLSLDEVGVLTDRNGGLGADIWHNMTGRTHVS